MNPLQEKFKNRRVHILGVAGTLMGSFAAYVKRQGLAVTGSDQNIYPPMSDVLANAGVEVLSPYSPSNITKAEPDLVIVGNVIRKTNPEMEEVVKLGIEYLSLPAAFETMILPSKTPLVVAGTHGKTTTTTMMAHILEKLGENPSFFIGGVPQDFDESFRVTDTKYMVLEGDEYDTAYFDKVPKFTHYRPAHAILTSIEYDHADIYADMGAVIAAFERLAALIPPSGSLIVCGESATGVKVAKKCKGMALTYGFAPGDQCRGENLTLTESGARFRFEGIDADLPMGGRHNALNALGCLALVKTLGLDVAKAAKALKSFRGIKRRQEVYAQARGITLLDDFAHHPTAVRETLSAVRSKNPTARIIACFEPRSATSRRKVFQKAYGESFDLADEVHIAKPYDQSAINQAEQFSTEDLLSDLTSRGKRAKILATDENSVMAFARSLTKGDVVLVMSNGGFDGFLPKLKKALESR